MSEGHGPIPETPETPPGWAAEQPPPYGAQGPSPWTAPGSEAPGQQPPPPPAYGPPPQQQQHHPGPGYGYAPPPALRPGIIPLRPLGLGDIFDGTIKLIRSNPRVMLGLSAVVAACAAVPVAIGQAVLLRDMGSLIANPGTTEADIDRMGGGFLGQYGGSIISVFIGLVAVTVLTGMIMRVLGRAVFGGKITAGEAWQLVKGRMGALFGVAGLTLALLLAPLVLIIPVFLLMSGVVAGQGAGGAAIGIGMVLLVFVLYIAYVLFINSRFSFASAAAVLEGLGPVAAMRRSWDLVTGDFWRVLGILLLTSVLANMISSLLLIPFMIIGFVVAIVGGGSLAAAVISAVLMAIGSTIGAMIAYPIQSGVAGLLYTDRRMRSEAFDLVLQTAAIEQQRQGWVHASADELWHPSNASRP
ncbi:hypothetical protein [Nonomuraea sp. NPDC046570]|uniref:glycerophosphoryl diester phosphodiesterase membrane domain-containing protein n=1 Tax=Nonomuraea sp. NPDC046570 TaxID=3155255 RepID=UPI0033F43E47